VTVPQEPQRLRASRQHREPQQHREPRQHREPEQHREPRRVEDALLQRAGAGDRRAFAQFYDLLAPRIYSRILSVLRDPAQSEEVVQEVFLELWQSAGTYRSSRGGAAGWALHRARERAIDRVRASQSDRLRDIRVGARDLVPETDPVADLIELRLASERLGLALTKLSMLQQEAVELAYGHGYSHSQIAELLGVPLGTVKSRLHDAIARLRQEYESA